jgi:serine/threonine protein kinase
MAGPFGEAAPGEVIGGYRLERLIGSGSTSQVFLGVQVRVNRQAAIKVLAHGLSDNKEVIGRMLREARVVNDIRHPNIIDILDFVETDSPLRVALVMEYIEGPSLKALRDKKLSFDQAIGIALQLVAAVEAAHKAGVIHRDIKPDNLLLTRDPLQDPRKIPTLKVVDFGIAKLAGTSGKTATGIMLGTPAYMAPEQVAGRPPASAATDVFAIGEVIYELLTGTRAYPSGAIHETVRAKLRGELPKLELPSVPGDKKVLSLITRCLAVKPVDRPSVEEVRDTLLDVMPPLRESSAWIERVARSGHEMPQPEALPVAARAHSSSMRQDGQPARPPPPDPADPMSQFAPAVLGHMSVEADIGPGSVQTEMLERIALEANSASETAAPPPAQTELMPRSPPDVAKSIPLADTVPTNKVFQAQTVASPLPERNRALDRDDSHAAVTPPFIDAEETEEVDASELRDGKLPLAAAHARITDPENDQIVTRANRPSAAAIDREAETNPADPRRSSTLPPLDPVAGGRVSSAADALGSSDKLNILERDTAKVDDFDRMPNTAPIEIGSARGAFPMTDVHPLSPVEAAPRPSSAGVLDTKTPIRGVSGAAFATSPDRSPGSQESLAHSKAAERRQTRLMLVVMAVLLVVALGLLIPMLLPPPSSRGEAIATVPGRVVVSSNPAGARVEEADTKQALGFTPVEVDLPKGARPKRLRISAAGYRPMEIDVSGSHPRVWIELERN